MRRLSTPSAKAHLVVSGLRYEVQNRVLLTDINLALAAGDTLCIVGANGSGKSIVLELLAGRRQPTGGTITTGGHEVFFLSRKEIGHSDAPTVSKAVEIASGCTPSCVMSELRRANIDPDQRVSSLSPGEVQRALFVAARCNDAAIVLLDDPTAGLDAEGFDIFERTVSGLAEAHRITVIATTSPDVVVELQASAVTSLVDGALRAVRPLPPTIEDLLET